MSDTPTPVSDRHGRTITLTIPGNAVGKGRARSAVRRGKGGKVITDAKGNPVIGTYTPEKTRNFEAVVKDLAEQAMGPAPIITRPIEIAITVHVAIPQSWPTWKREAAIRQEIAPTVKPDLDNIEKALKDALNGVVWVDDVQVVACDKSKLYVDNGRAARTEITIRENWRCHSGISKRAELVLLR